MIERGRAHVWRSGPLFLDNSRDSIKLLQQMNAEWSVRRQSPYLETADFFSERESMDDFGVHQMLNRYKVYWEKMLNNPADSITAPEVYDIVEALHSASSNGDAVAWRRLQDILFEKNPEFVLKATKITEETASQIAQEIKCGFFLNELNIGYTHVLTPHFMQIVDWWCIKGSLLPGQTVKNVDIPEIVWQFEVSEKLSHSIRTNVTASNGLEGLRHQLFQIFLSLEVAWLSNRYIHYDLYCRNVFLKNLGPSSALYNKNLLYKRFNNDTEWYRLEASALSNRIVKILDYGLNRMYVPEFGADIITGTGESVVVRHSHHKLLFVTGVESSGQIKEGNRSYDVRTILMEILNFVRLAEFKQLKKERDYDAFCEMLDSVFRFDQLEQQLETVVSEDVDEEFYKPYYRKKIMKHFLTRSATSAKSLLEAVSLLDSKEDFTDWYQLYQSLIIFSTVDTGATATSCLNMRFFDALKQVDAGDSDDNVIVSFPMVDLTETVFPPEATPHMKLDTRQERHGMKRCHVCGKTARKQSNYNNERLPFCGEVCYQFRYLYDCESSLY
jgi:hypothetical protein